jgi:hypothetical protein
VEVATMSRVYFHSPSGDAELRGSERAHAGWLSSAIGIAALDLNDYDFRERTGKHIDAGHPLRDVQAAETALRAGDVHFVVPSGRYSAWEVLLNTCLAIGSDPLCFLTRMHAQCEIHAWVDGPDRTWLAGVIADGRRAGLMREGQGWEDVSACLLACADEPVVMSYSVCDQFPSRSAATWEPPIVDGEKNWDAWYDLDEAARWRLAMAGVQELRFGPDTMRRPFGHRKTAFDIRREIAEVAR